MALETTETAKALYDRLKTNREPYLLRARKCAKVTIPHLFPDAGSSGTTEFDTPYQSVGARGVNNLGAKILLAIMPPNTPFFRLSPNEENLPSLKDSQGLKDQIDDALRSLEETVMKYVDAYQIRVTVGESIKQALVSGNALLYLPPDKEGIKLYRLDNYVLQRDALGNVIQIVTCDKIAYAALSTEFQSYAAPAGQTVKPEDLVEVYTHTVLEADNYISYQEIEGQRVGKDNTYPKETTPWIPIRMNKVDGEDYGRSYVEEYYGDLKSLESLSQAIIDLAAIAASIRFLVNPTGITRVKKLVETPNGGFCAGRLADVEALQLNKYNDLQVAKATSDAIESRLSYAFLFNSAVQRNGERVTAEEIRYVAGELEDTLGGIYSILSVELQLPLVKRLLNQLEKTQKIATLPEGSTEPEITTGMEALGRGQDLQVLEYFLTRLVIPSAQAEGTGLKRGAFLSRGADALGLSKSELIMSDEEIQAMEQQRQLAAMGEAATPELVKMMAAQGQQ